MGVFAVADVGAAFAGLKLDGVVVAVGLAEGAVVEEVVAHPDIDHGGLRGDGFDGGVWMDAGHHGEESRVAGAEDADAAVVVGQVFDGPVDGVVGVGAFVGGFRICRTVERMHHGERALGAEAAADVSVDVDIAFASELWALLDESFAGVAVDAVGRAREQDGQRAGDVGRGEDDEVKLDSVAGGNIGDGAHVVVEDVVDGVASAMHGRIRLAGDSDAQLGCRACAGEAESGLLFFVEEVGFRQRHEFRGRLAVALKPELAIFGVEAQRRIRIGVIGVLAGEAVELRGAQGNGPWSFLWCLRGRGNSENQESKGGQEMLQRQGESSG